MREAETWDFKRSGEAIVEGTVSVAVETPGLKSHGVKLRLGIMKRT